MLSKTTNIITGLIAALLMSVFVIGLAHSISTGFAGVSGGLPFTIIVASVLAMVAYDFWDECVRRK